MYKGVESDIYDDRKQELPIVTNVKLGEVKETTFKYNDSDVDAYSVTLNWEYEDDLEYDDEKEFILIKEDDKKLSIVQMNDIEKSTED